MKKYFKGIICFAFMAVVMTMYAWTAAAEEPPKDLHAKAALLLDADNNRVLFEKNGYDIMAMASTTKIMTCILALEYGDFEKEVEVSSYAASMPKVHLGVRKGEKYKLKDLIYSLMLESHNDSAVVIAEEIGGSVEGFANMMNQKAKELGCNDTFFITPNGLDATVNGKSHSTTARDLAVIAAYAIKKEEFVPLVMTRSHDFTNAKGTRSFHVDNKNRFLDMMDGAIGIKTGFTCEAGYCFVGAVRQDGKTFISVVLGCGWPPNRTWKWADTKRLMQYGLHNYEKQEIYSDTPFGNVPVEEGVVNEVSTIKQGKSISLLLSESDQVERAYQMPQKLQAPVKKGELLGYEDYYINGELYDRVGIVAAEDVALRDFPYCLKQILGLYFPKIAS